MRDKLDDSAPFDDEQGTRTADEKPTKAGAEAMRGTDGKPLTSSQDHHSAYGGKGGEPKEPNDVPTSRR
jgi:hypothetical protein